MKIVMHYTEGDGCTYSCEVDLPFEYESSEQALVDFEELFTKSDGIFKFLGMEFYKFAFISGDQVFLPEFYTLEEWFEQKRIN